MKQHAKFCQYLYSIGVIDFTKMKEVKGQEEALDNLSTYFTRMEDQQAADMVQRMFIIYRNRMESFKQKQSPVKQRKDKYKSTNYNEEKSQDQYVPLSDFINVNPVREQKIQKIQLKPKKYVTSPKRPEKPLIKDKKENSKQVNPTQELHFLEKVRSLLRTQKISPTQAKKMINSMKQHKEIKQCTFKPQINVTLFQQKQKEKDRVKQTNFEETVQQDQESSGERRKQMNSTDKIKEKLKQMMTVGDTQEKNQNMRKIYQGIMYQRDFKSQKDTDETGSDKFNKERAMGFFEKIEQYQKRKKNKLDEIRKQASQDLTFSPKLNEKSKLLVNKSKQQGLYYKLERKLKQKNQQLSKMFS